MVDFLPNQGTEFDDIKADKLRDRSRRQEHMAGIDDDMVPFFRNVRERPHAKVFVKTPRVAQVVNHLLAQWYMDGMIPTKPSVSLDSKLALTQVVVE